MLRFPPRIILAPNLRVEARVVAVVDVEAAFGDVFAVGLAGFAGVGDDGGHVAGGGGGGGGGSAGGGGAGFLVG